MSPVVTEITRTTRCVIGVILMGYLEELLYKNGNYSGMQLRDILSERGQASRLSEQKCFLQEIF